MSNEKIVINKEFLVYANKNEKEIFSKIQEDTIQKVFDIEIGRNKEINIKRNEIKETINTDARTGKSSMKGELCIMIKTIKEHKVEVEKKLSEIENELKGRKS
jgi:hypothetical protein